MTGSGLDWAGVLTGEPLQWLLSGLAMTVFVTIAGALAATPLAAGLFALRISPWAALKWPAAAVIEVLRDTPLLMQLLFWYFAAWGLLPDGWRDWVISDHARLALPGAGLLITPEFLTASWGLGLFFSAFLAEELRAGLAAVPQGQVQAAQSQGFDRGAILRHILLPQALANAWQPVVGQYLNLMKHASLAAGIGLAELAYQVRQIESLNAHTLEAFAAGAALYLALGLALGRLLGLWSPRWRRAGGRRRGA